MTKQSYQKPTVTSFGTVADLTAASFTNTQRDSIFFNGVVVGSAIGSMDACIAKPADDPSSNCL